MKTIYWLSVLGMCYGYGVFFFVWYMVTQYRDKLTLVTQATLTIEGVISVLPFRTLLVGIVSTVVFFTI